MAGPVSTLERKKKDGGVIFYFVVSGIGMAEKKKEKGEYVKSNNLKKEMIN